MRLIDADKLKETLLHYNYTTEHSQIFRYINEQPTVYDIDKEIYNKAIDDLVKFANTNPSVEMDDGEIRPMWLEEMAEKLKKAGKNHEQP